ncbi:MAG: SOS response-associated peptidase [Syntrophales bacterium]
MCGRFVLLTDLSGIATSFAIGEIACEYRRSNNIYPGQQIAAVIRDEVNRLVEFRWGLIPSWAKDPSIGNGLTNARAETVADKPSFRQAFRKRRCLIVADGFYEWQKTDGQAKKPWFIHLRSGQPCGFAGLYETWTSPEGRPVHSCTIITTKANQALAAIHDRMPVIVSGAAQAIWLDTEKCCREELLSLLVPYPAEDMACRQQYPVPF